MTKYASILDLYYQAKTLQPNKTAFVFSYPSYSEGLTYNEIWNLALAQAKRFKDLGVQPKDRVGIWAATSWRWEIAQLGLLICNAVVVGIDINEPARNFSKIEELTGLKFILSESESSASEWKGDRISSVQFIPLFVKFDNAVAPAFEYSRIGNIEDEEAFIIFTSGTTSEPKAISYTHGKIILAVKKMIELFPEVAINPRTVCWLPLSNLFQKMSNFSTVANTGEVFFLDNPKEIVNALAQINPIVFISVPRLFEKIYDSFNAKIERLFFPLNYLVIFGIFLSKTRLQFGNCKILSILLKLVLFPWNVLVFKKLKNLFGGSLKFLISGSAPLRREVLIFFHSLELPILEVYGISENVIPVAANRLTEFKLGSVGKPVVANSVKILEDGEILVQNGGLFTGYIKLSTEDCFQDGFYKTGDLGYFDKENFLFIIGRKSEMFKTSTGKKIAVTEIETTFKRLPFIDQVVILGEGRKVPFAVLTIDLANLEAFVNTHIESVFDNGTKNLNKIYRDQIQESIQDLVRVLDFPVKPGGALVLTRPFTIEGDELTINLKLKRKSIERKFSKLLDKLSSESESKSIFPIHFVSNTELEANT